MRHLWENTYVHRPAVGCVKSHCLDPHRTCGVQCHRAHVSRGSLHRSNEHKRVGYLALRKIIPIVKNTPIDRPAVSRAPPVAAGIEGVGGIVYQVIQALVEFQVIAVDGWCAESNHQSVTAVASDGIADDHATAHL